MAGKGAPGEGAPRGRTPSLPRRTEPGRPAPRPIFLGCPPPELRAVRGHPRPEQGHARSLPHSLPPHPPAASGGTGTRDPPLPRGLTGFRGISVDGISGDIHFLHPCVLPAGQSPHGRAGAQRAGCGGVPSRPGPAPAPGLAAAAAAAPARSILRSAPRPAPPPR